jgi:hypothetical protein
MQKINYAATSKLITYESTAYMYRVLRLYPYPQIPQKSEVIIKLHFVRDEFKCRRLHSKILNIYVVRQRPNS